MVHCIKHSIKERQYICLLLNKLFISLVPENVSNRFEIAMEWIAAIREIDGVMISVRGGSVEPFCVNIENNYMCFEGDYPGE